MKKIQKSEKRAIKKKRRPYGVSGRSVFLLQKLARKPRVKYKPRP